MKLRHLLFIAPNRDAMHFIVKENKEVWYSDRKWGSIIRILPQPDNLISMIRNSRNRIPPMIINMFRLTDEEKNEYNSAKDYEELAKIIIKDAALKGCKLQFNNEVVQDG